MTPQPGRVHGGPLDGQILISLVDVYRTLGKRVNGDPGKRRIVHYRKVHKRWFDGVQIHQWYEWEVEE
jgi:hypothetical protein